MSILFWHRQRDETFAVRAECNSGVYFSGMRFQVEPLTCKHVPDLNSIDPAASREARAVRTQSHAGNFAGRRIKRSESASPVAAFQSLISPGILSSVCIRASGVTYPS